MSTKIYNGYCCTSKSWPSVHRLLTKFRDKLKPVADRMFRKQVAASCTALIDFTAVNVPVPEHMRTQSGAVVWLMVKSQLFQGVLEAGRNSGRSDLDFACEVVLVPAQGQRILALLYTQQKEFEKIWNSMPGVVPFGYWNNTDPPEGMTDGKGYQKWKERGRIWERALGKLGVPALAGYARTVFDFHLMDFEWDSPKLLVKHVPDFEYRCRTTSLELLSYLKFDREAPAGEVFSFLRASTTEGTEENQKFLQTVEEIKPKLKEWLAVEDFEQVIK